KVPLLKGNDFPKFHVADRFITDKADEINCQFLAFLNLQSNRQYVICLVICTDDSGAFIAGVAVHRFDGMHVIFLYFRTEQAAIEQRTFFSADTLSNFVGCENVVSDYAYFVDPVTNAWRYGVIDLDSVIERCLDYFRSNFG